MTDENTDQSAPGDDEDWPGTDEIERAKWAIDGAATLAEAAAKARGFADRLQALHEQGFVLREPVRDDYAFYYKPDTQLSQET